MEQDVSLAGNAYVRDAGTQLERLRPDRVTIVSTVVRDEISGTEIRRVLGYHYDPDVNEDREEAFYPVDEVAHWSPIPDPLASFRGMSWLTPVLREIDADQSMTDYKRAYLTNAATPNLIIKYSDKIGTERLNRVGAQIRARHGGVENAFSTLLLDEGADPMVVGSSFEQMSYTATQAAGENRIAVAAGVPAIVAGLKEGLDSATYSNYELAMRRFADLTMRPNWRSACGALAKLVVVPAGARLWFDATGIAALRQGEKEAADTMAVLATAASSLINAGYDPESVKASLAASDVTLLKHTGLVSVQLQAPGSMPAEPPQDPGGQP
jgi:phage portal protein BeeE